MASLISNIRKAGLALDSQDIAGYRRFNGEFVRRILDRDTIVIGADSVRRDLDGLTGKECITELVSKRLRVTPGRREYWFDFSFPNGQKCGVLCERHPVDAGCEVDLAFFSGGFVRDVMTAIFIGCCTLIVSPEGAISEVPTIHTTSLLQDIDGDKGRVGVYRLLWVVLHTLARLNCSNVSIRPTASTKGGCRPGPTCPIPMSTFNEIVVDNSPKYLSGGRGIFQKDWAEVRFHTVRGHYRRKPNSGEMVWVQEYGRGNKDLGQVVPTYLVQ